MFFLLRIAFWLGLVLVLLPSDKTADSAKLPQIGAADAVSAASAAVSDMSQFCTRQPDACAVGAQAATIIGHRAQAGAKKVYDFIQKQDDAKSDPREHKADPKTDSKSAGKPDPRDGDKHVRDKMRDKKPDDTTGSVEDMAQGQNDSAPLHSAPPAIEAPSQTLGPSDLAIDYVAPLTFE